MRKLILIVALLSVITIHAIGQTNERRFSYTTFLGTGISMTQPSCTPFTWQVMSLYHINKRLAVGAGSGISIYEKMLIPLYASARFFIIRPKKFTPYLECNIGGAVAATKDTNGGFYLSPSVGAQIRINQKLKMNIALGYELQELKRLKMHTGEYFHTEFKEELSHNTLALKLGLTY